MKTIILFSSIFYLLGLKLGSTLTFFRNLAAPVKSVISLPVEKTENSSDSGKSYFYYNEKRVRDVKHTQKDSLKVSQSRGESKQSSLISEKLN
jgi:hypothetical protein